MRALLVCSHNTFKGPRPRSIELYGSLQPDILCLQEGAVGEDGQTTVDRIAREMGPNYRGLFNVGGQIHSSGTLYDAFAVIYNAQRIECVEELVTVPLSQISQAEIPRWQNAVWIRNELTHRNAMAMRFRNCEGGRPFTVVNFHLIAEGTMEGGNRVRRRQAEALAMFLDMIWWHDRVVLCGDTNARGSGRKEQRKTLRFLLEPFVRFGVRDIGDKRTHSFSRLIVNKFPAVKSLEAFLSFLDKDYRYDVVATNLPTLASATWGAGDSDHDMVGAWIAPDAA